MATQIRPGATIMLIRSTDGEPFREQAKVTTTDGDRVTVSLESSDGWRQKEPAVLVRSEAGAMWAAPALCERQMHDWAIFQVLRDWAPTNRRQSPRFETRLGASIRNERGGPIIKGRLLDISDSGARLMLDAAPRPSGVELVITALDHQIEIPCDVVDTVISGSHFETRLRFRYVFPHDQPVLASLLDLMGSLHREGRDLLAR